MMTGRIHSVESFGALDGPGIRFVVFFQGCPLHCLYCHNPDSWDAEDGREVTVEELLSQMDRFKGFLHRGGVTLSGGEPLLQHAFVEELLKGLKERGVHTAIDTSGAVPLQDTKACIDLCDMLLLDIKSIDPALCTELTGHSNRSALETLDYCESQKKPVWIRHVVVPGYTLDDRQLSKLAEKLDGYSCIELIELLPFHKMGEYKWEGLNRTYALKDTREPTDKEMAHARTFFFNRGLPVR